MARVLCVSSSYDLPTRYVSAWIGRIAEEARLLGHQVLSLMNADEAALRSAIESFQPKFCFMGGHGSGTTLTTTNLQPLLVACQNDEMLSGTQVLFASCLTGISLVPSVMSKDGVAAAGFTAEFTWVVGEPYDPATDVYSKPFERLIVEPAVEVLRALSFGPWFTAIRRIGAEEERTWGLSEDPLASQIVYCLRHNVGAATVMGEGVVRAGMGSLLLVPLLWWLLQGEISL